MDAVSAAASGGRRWSLPVSSATVVSFIVLFVLFSAAQAAAEAAGRIAPPVADYGISARLDPIARTVSGHQVLRWRNPTGAPATELRFLLALNAFSDPRTALMTAMYLRQQLRIGGRGVEDGGQVSVTGLRVRAKDMTARLEFIQPDDNNPADRSLARLPLDDPVAPGEHVEIEMDFVSQLPPAFVGGRPGAPAFLVARWYPQIAVFENGQWKAHQYLFPAAPYADFGSYEVSLTVPGGFAIGHTGSVVAEWGNGDGTRTVRIRAQGVNDFAWVAGPSFRVVERELLGTHVRLLLQPSHSARAPRYLAALENALNGYRSWLGSYPYPELTVVDDWGRLSSDGHDAYPMLFPAATSWWVPSGLRLLEHLVVDGVGYQYWSAGMAPDEFESGGLAGGLNSYATGRLMDDSYGPRASYLDWFHLRVDATAKHRFDHVRTTVPGKLAGVRGGPRRPPALDAVNPARLALVLRSLERQCHRRCVLDALSVFWREWRFRHPRLTDFYTFLRLRLGDEVVDALNAAREGAGVLDYAVTELDVRALPRATRDGRSERTDYRSEVVVERLGEVVMPVEIVVTLEDRTETREVWDGRARWRRLEIVSKERAEYAEVDPDRKLPLDIDLLNNSRMRSAGTRGVVRLAGRAGVWVQNALHLLTAF